MRILIVDSDVNSSRHVEQIVRLAFPNASIDVETNEDEACYLVERKEYSAVLTETKRINFACTRLVIANVSLHLTEDLLVLHNDLST